MVAAHRSATTDARLPRRLAAVRARVEGRGGEVEVARLVVEQQGRPHLPRQEGARGRGVATSRVTRGRDADCLVISSTTSPLTGWAGHVFSHVAKEA